MPIAHRTSSINPDFLEQLRSNTKKDSTVIEEPSEPAVQIRQEKEPALSAAAVSPVTETKAPVVKIQDERKEKYADVMNVRLSKGRRNEIKAFCSGCGISVTQYIESSFEFLSKEVAQGKIVISKGGITKVE